MRRRGETELEIECVNVWTTDCSIFDRRLLIAKVDVVERNYTVKLVRFYQVTVVLLNCLVCGQNTDTERDASCGRGPGGPAAVSANDCERSEANTVIGQSNDS
jgi:hypothetical protein